MTTATTLTDLEAACLAACLNYDDREAQLSDNFSNGSFDTLPADLDISPQALGGVVASLIKKNLVAYFPEDDDIVWLTEAGVNAIFDYTESN